MPILRAGAHIPEIANVPVKLVAQHGRHRSYESYASRR